MLKDLLQVTRDIEHDLEGNGYKRLPALLARRSEIFARLDAGAIPPEGEALLLAIRASEDRCLAMAAAQKKELQAGLSAVRVQRKLEKAYGRHR